MSYGEPHSPSLADVEAVVRENVSGQVDGDRHEQGKQQLLATLQQRRPGAASQLRRVVLATASVTLLVASGAYAWKRHSAKPLSYEAAGTLPSDSGYLRSSGPGGASLTFSDGTHVALQDGARARIAAVDAHGARLAIENGRVALDVGHLPDSAWYVDAGPFVMQVTGTRFDVDWSSYDDTLSVELQEGSLMVSGPPAPSGILLRAGQRLTAHEGRLSIEALDAAMPPAWSDPPAVDATDPGTALPQAEPASSADLPKSAADF